MLTFLDYRRHCYALQPTTHTFTYNVHIITFIFNIRNITIIPSCNRSPSLSLYFSFCISLVSIVFSLSILPNADVIDEIVIGAKKSFLDEFNSFSSSEFSRKTSKSQITSQQWDVLRNAAFDLRYANDLQHTCNARRRSPNKLSNQL